MAQQKMAPEDRTAFNWAMAAGALAIIVLSLAGTTGCTKKQAKVVTPTPAPTPVAAAPKALPTPISSDLLGTVRFDFDRWELSEDAKSVLRGVAGDLDAAVTLRVEGHADDRGSTEYNLSLSEKRAAAVLQYLKDLGAPAARVSTVAYGEEKPLDTAATPEAHAKNRRAELRVVRQEKLSQN